MISTSASRIPLYPIFLFPLSAAAVLLCGCAANKGTAGPGPVRSRSSHVVDVTAQVKYFLSEIPPGLIYGEVYGHEAAIGVYGTTNVKGVVFEILEPKEFEGRIYTLRGSRWHGETNCFGIGDLYEFRARVRDIGQFSFDQTTSIPARKLSSVEATKKIAQHSAPRLDDLEWLVGRWRCITREWLIPMDGPLGSACEDALDYFNVYFPYADEHLTLKLSDNPDDRPIAAEFLARHVFSWNRFEERLVAMMEPGPVRISKDRIWVGYPFGTVEFLYSRRDGSWGTLLTLESKSMRLELYKLSADAGEIKESFVHAPIRDFPPEKIAELKKRYAEMCKFSNAATEQARP